VACRRLALLLGVLGAHLSADGRAALAQSPEQPAPAASTAPVRLLVLESVPEFSARVRGQVSDLDLTLAVEATSPLSSQAEVEALVAARAAQRAADVVAWLGELPGKSPADARNTMVYVWIAGHDRVHARRVGPRANAASSESAPRPDNAPSLLPNIGAAAPGERSATLEAAALVVRSAVRAVRFEREGAAAEPSLDEPAPTPAPPAPAPARPTRLEADRGASEGTEQPPHAVRWSPRAGLDWSNAGLNPNGFWSVSAGLDLHFGPLSGGASASWSFVEPALYRGVEFALDRRALLAEVGWAVLDHPNFALRPKLGAGAAWLTRTTTATAWGGDGQPPHTSLSPLVTGDLVAECQLTGPFTLDLHGGVRWFAHTTRFLVDSPEGDVALASGWRFQPNAGIALRAIF
jgi:hypothetical protein